MFGTKVQKEKQIDLCTVLKKQIRNKLMLEQLLTVLLVLKRYSSNSAEVLQAIKNIRITEIIGGVE